MSELLERVQPQAIEAEEAVLGCCLVAPAALDEALEILKPGDFYRKAHADIYRAILGLSEKGEPVDLISVSTALRNQELLDYCGGYPYLMDLAGSIPSASNVAYYAKIVQGKSEARKAIELGQRIVEQGFNEEIRDPLGWAAGEVLKVTSGSAGSSIATVKDIAPEVAERIRAARESYELYGGSRIANRRMVGIPTLDEFNHGAGLDNLVILAARPAMGKTSLALQMACNIAEGKGSDEPLPVIFYSLEMSRDDLLLRIASARTGIDNERIQMGFITGSEEERLYEELSYLGTLPLFIEDSSDISVGRIRASSRRIKTQYGKLGAIFVDYLQLMGANQEEVKQAKQGFTSKNRQEEVAANSRGLKLLAKELRAPCYALSQLSRSCESRADKRPMLSDLRESGAIEQDADEVWFAYRDEYYNPDSTDKGICEIIWAKNRDGRCGKVRIGFEAQTTSFFDLNPLSDNYYQPLEQKQTNTIPFTPPAKGIAAERGVEVMYEIGEDDEP